MVVQTMTTILAGAAFGLALAAPPGPMNAIIAEESVVRGWWAGFQAGLGAMTADLLFFMLALVGVVTVVEQHPTVRAVMVLLGGLLMLYFARDVAHQVHTALSSTTSDTGRGFRKALVLGLTNPYQILFWVTVGTGLLTPGELDVFAVLPLVGDQLAGLVVVQTGSLALVVGLFGGVCCWILSFPALLVVGRRRVDAFAPAVAILSAVVLAGFGIWFLVDGLSTLS
jgi:threonine/homoserine/homoserine lactone efflux protein